MINKKQTGFKFGIHPLTVLKTFGELRHNVRTYRLLQVKTHDNLVYTSLRLYNGNGKFIKQFLFEPEITGGLIQLLCEVENGNY